MPILLGIVGGMSIGVASAFLTAIVADLPFMGWANSLVPLGIFPDRNWQHRGDCMEERLTA